MTPPSDDRTAAPGAAAGRAPRRPSAEFLRGFALHQAGDLAQAQAVYQGLLARHPDDPDALHMLGLIALQHGDARRALTLIDAALGHDPANSAAWCNRGNALQAQGLSPAA